jgi:hypothetical protein
MGHVSAAGRLRVPIYLSVGTIYQIRVWVPRPNIFVDNVSPMNVIGYIHRFHITDECIVTFVGTDE